MRKFMCKSDIYLIEKIICKKDTVIFENDTLKSDDDSITIVANINFINVNDFEEILNFEFSTKEVSEEEELIEKDWIIQLKVTCSRKKLRNIEDIIKKEINSIL